jgi:hypothetical protein
LQCHKSIHAGRHKSCHHCSEIRHNQRSQQHPHSCMMPDRDHACALLCAATNTSCETAHP